MPSLACENGVDCSHPAFVSQHTCQYELCRTVHLGVLSQRAPWDCGLSPPSRTLPESWRSIADSGQLCLMQTCMCKNAEADSAMKGSAPRSPFTHLAIHRPKQPACMSLAEGISRLNRHGIIHSSWVRCANLLLVRLVMLLSSMQLRIHKRR